MTSDTANSWRYRFRLAAMVVALLAVLGLHPVSPALSQEAPAPPVVPVLHPYVPAGGGDAVDVASTRPSKKTLDGDPGDWIGVNPMFGGVTLYSAGELIYQDHLFDARGPASDETVQTAGIFDTASEVHSGIARIESLLRVLAAEPAIGLNEFQYGALPLQDEADLLEFRVASDKKNLWLLARTTTMNTENPTAVVVLIDTDEAGTLREVPFDTGISTSRAEYAVLLSSTGVGRLVDLESGTVTDVDVAADPTGYVNTIEARLPLAALAAEPVAMAAATGFFDEASIGLADPGVSPRLMNVAFRAGEPLRGSWFDYRQALTLNQGTIDPFFTSVDMSKLESGASQTWVPRHGYQDRIFISTETISVEADTRGVHQHYGAYLPQNYQPGVESPMTMFLRGSAGTAHEMPWLIPGLLRDLGDNHNNIIISPSGRDGELTWYFGASHVDIMEAFEDAQETFAIDETRRYISGYSMGGWGTNLLSMLYPDVFAAGFNLNGIVSSSSGPTGVDMDDCNELQGPYTGIPHPMLEWPASPCYLGIFPSHTGDPADVDLRRLMVNLRHVPYVEYRYMQDTATIPTNSLVKLPGLTDLGYRYRMYVFPVGDHYQAGIVDEYPEGAAYINRFRLDPNPARVTYKRDMRIERAVEQTMYVPYGPDVPESGRFIEYEFDHSFWVSEITPVDMENGEALVDVTSLAINAVPVETVLEAGGPTSPGQSGPYVMFGQSWQDIGTAPATQNAFDAVLTGTSRVQLDVGRMNIDISELITGVVDTEHDLALRLNGDWGGRASVSIDGHQTTVEPQGDVLEIALPAGSSTLEIRAETSKGRAGAGGAKPSKKNVASGSAATAGSVSSGSSTASGQVASASALPKTGSGGLAALGLFLALTGVSARRRQ